MCMILVGESFFFIFGFWIFETGFCRNFWYLVFSFLIKCLLWIFLIINVFFKVIYFLIFFFKIVRIFLVFSGFLFKSWKKKYLYEKVFIILGIYIFFIYKIEVVFFIYFKLISLYMWFILKFCLIKWLFYVCREIVKIIVLLE